MSVGFFNGGRTMAYLRVSGKTPWWNEALTLFVIVSAYRGSWRFISDVGAGCSEQCFAGAWLTIFVMSAAVAYRRTDNLAVAWSAIDLRRRCTRSWRTNQVHFRAEMDSEVISGVRRGHFVFEKPLIACLYLRPDCIRIVNIRVYGFNNMVFENTVFTMYLVSNLLRWTAEVAL
jgi:hypothetical protein